MDCGTLSFMSSTHSLGKKPTWREHRSERQKRGWGAQSDLDNMMKTEKAANAALIPRCGCHASLSAIRSSVTK